MSDKVMTSALARRIERDQLRTEVRRLRDALILARDELSRADLSDKDARNGTWTLIDAALGSDKN